MLEPGATSWTAILDAVRLDHDGELPVVEGTLIRLKVEHLSKERDAPPVWLWSPKTDTTPDDVDRSWQAFLRRFDLEHTFRFAKQTLGWTTPKLRTPEAADRWTWILIVAHTQLRLARPLVADLRRPWEKPTTSVSEPFMTWRSRVRDAWELKGAVGLTSLFAGAGSGHRCGAVVVTGGLGPYG